MTLTKKVRILQAVLAGMLPGMTIWLRWYEMLMWAMAVTLTSAWMALRVQRERRAEDVRRALSPERPAQGGIVGADAPGVGIMGQGANGAPGGMFRTDAPWYVRLWRLVSNPVRYVVRGEVRW